MQQPNPWILFMGGLALLNVAGVVGGLHGPAWARYLGVATCILLGLAAMGLGLRKQFGKKPARPKHVPRARRARTDGDRPHAPDEGRPAS